jgi:NAD(P)-dependent dehydrogenase (short-subunit alcohol dehydrogenase family)
MRLRPEGGRPLAGRVAVVTGVARERGFGRAISLRLAEEGARPVQPTRPPLDTPRAVAYGFRTPPHRRA